MKSGIAIKSVRATGAASSRNLLALCVVSTLFGVLAFGAFAYLNNRQRANLTRSMEELSSQNQSGANQQDRESFALTVGKAKQGEALTELRKTTNVLEKLNTEVGRFLKMGEKLRRATADSQTAVGKFFEEASQSIPRVSEITMQRDRTRGVIFQIESAQGTPYLPDPAIVAGAKKTAEWATTNSQKVADLRKRLDEIMRDPQYAARAESASPNAVASPQTAERRADISNPPAEIETARILAEIKTDAAKIVDQARKDVAQILAEANTTAAGILDLTKTEAAGILEEARKAAADILAETRREAEKKVAEGEQKPVAQSSSTEAASDLPVAIVPAIPEKAPFRAPEPETGPAKLEDVVADPVIRTRLLSFTTPGTMRIPGSFRAERAPISLNQMRSFGALEPDMRGLQRLVEIATTPQDRLRPRWKLKKTGGRWDRNKSEIAQASAIQQILIEFGPELVSKGFLAE